MTRPKHILAAEVYDGDGGDALKYQLISLANGRIASVEAAPARLPRDTVEAEVVSPGFIDLQINGAADVQFNDDPTPEAVARIAHGARDGGTAHILPTFITAPRDTYRAAITAVRKAMRHEVPGILGVHLEGPFLSPERPGIHPPNCIRPLTPEDVEAICAAGPVTLVTLAPECQDPALVRGLTRAGVTVFAGHCTPTADQIAAATGDGLSGATHLWNAMPPLAGRAPGLVGRTLTDPRLFAGIIADGHHVDPLNLRLAATMMPDRLCLVTDAMCTLAGTRTGFEIFGVPITLRDGRLTGPGGTLAGAHVAMDESMRNMVRFAGISPGLAIAMASRNPARAIGLGGELGRIAPGYRASLTCLSADFRAERVIVDGQLFPKQHGQATGF